MRIKLVAASTLVAAGLALTGCSSSSTATDSSSAMTTAASSTTGSATAKAASGTFAGLNDKKVAGTVSVADGKITLTGFSSDQGPDLHLYLTNGTDEQAVSGGTELGKVAYDQASQTFTVPAGVDAGAFKDVVVHCDKAKAVFGAASLS